MYQRPSERLLRDCCILFYYQKEHRLHGFTFQTYKNDYYQYAMTSYCASSENTFIRGHSTSLG